MEAGGRYHISLKSSPKKPAELSIQIDNRGTFAVICDRRSQYSHTLSIQ